MSTRRGVTLVEVFVVIGILGVLIALLIPAIQNVRNRAARLRDENNLRQIVLAWHSYASTYSGRLPGYAVDSIVAGPFPVPTQSPLYNVLPFLEPGAAAPYGQRYPVGPAFGVDYPIIETFLSPTDPTLHRMDALGKSDGPCSYAVNGQVFAFRSRLPSSMPDGTAYTIAISQHYYSTHNRDNKLVYASFSRPLKLNEEACRGPRACTFADPFHLDAIPRRSAGRTTSSLPGVTFQVAPAEADADGRVLQATQTPGLLAGMFDGSVRTFAPSVAEEAFWSAVTPAFGEAENDP